jgi:hypothetical protein
MMSIDKQSTELWEKLQRLHDEGRCSEEELAGARLDLIERNASDEIGKEKDFEDWLYYVVLALAVIPALGLRVLANL